MQNCFEFCNDLLVNLKNQRINETADKNVLNEKRLKWNFMR